MKNNRLKVALVALVSIASWISPAAKADEWDQKTTFTFSGPVEIPGQVLSPGTYVFKLADSQADRNIVQVFDKSQRHLYGTFLRHPGSAATTVRKADHYVRRKSGGFAGSDQGVVLPGRYVWSPVRVSEAQSGSIGQGQHAPVPSMPSELAENTTKPATTMNEPHVVAMRQAPLKAQKPTEEEVEIAEIFIAPDPAPVPAPAQLPATASMLPLAGALGLLLIGASAIGSMALRAK
ncbi:MAG: hypothetical protein WDO73_34710 [Ignavibacteriota bacterium]